MLGEDRPACLLFHQVSVRQVATHIWSWGWGAMLEVKSSFPQSQGQSLFSVLL